PAGFTIGIQARVKTAAGKPAALATLVHTSALGSTADLTVASTLVTTSLLDAGGSALGDFNAATYSRAVQATADGLTPGDVPDLADHAAVVAAMDRLAGAVAGLKDDLGALRQDLAKIDARLGAIQDQLAKLVSPGPTPAGPAATPSPTPPTPSPP